MRWSRGMAGAVVALALAAGMAGAGEIAGRTAEERAVNGAKAYLAKKGLKEVSLSILISGLFTKAVQAEAIGFERQTGVALKNFVEVGVPELHPKIMAEAVAKTGKYDLMLAGPPSIPDAVGAGILLPLDDWIREGRPDIGDMVDAFIGQGKYKGKVYGYFSDGDHFILALRRDWLENREEAAKFKAKYGWGPGCPDTYGQWQQLAEFYTRDLAGAGRTDFFGALAYRSRNWGFRWWLQQFYSKGVLPFDDAMHPLIASPEGIETTKEYVELAKFMPKDILSWATPQAYPFFAQGNAFSILTYASVTLAAEDARKSKIAGKVRYCMVPGSLVKGKLLRRSLQAFGTTFMISRYSKHPEAAYWLIQYLTSKEVSARVVSNPDSVFDPFLKSHFRHPLVLKTRTKEMLDAAEKNAQVVASMILLEGSAEYHDALDQNIMEALLGHIPAEEATKRTAQAWEKITDQIGRPSQIEAWRALKRELPTKSVPD